MRALVTEEPTRVSPTITPAWGVRVRLVASLLIAAHVTAVFVAPWSGPPPSSRLSMQCQRFFRVYLNAAFLNHGYRFFAPNPGPSHLLKYEVETMDGETVEGVLPDLKVHWPRLFYHRHFMISEFVFAEAADVLGEIDETPMTEEERSELAGQRERARKFGRSVAESLMERYDGRRVRLLLVEHRIPPPWEVREGLNLNDASLFDERELGVFEKLSPTDETELIP